MKRNRLFFIGIIVVISIVAFANPPKRYTIYNTWSNIHLVDDKAIQADTDSTIVLISNRAFNPTDTAFFMSERDPLEQIRIVIAQCIRGQWYVHQLTSLDEALAYLPHDDFVFYTEGMGKTFPLNLQRGVAMSTQYKVNVVMFDYPSIDPKRSWFTNFSFSYEQAKDAAKTYGLYLEAIQETMKNKPEMFESVNTTLFNHSMGNRMVKHLILNNYDKNLIDLNIDKVVLNAACVPGKDHQQWVSRLNFANQVVINYNKDDKQLNGASIITFDKMLGVGFDEPLADNAIYVDMNPSLGKRHSAFLEVEGRKPVPQHVKVYFYSLLKDADMNVSHLFIQSENMLSLPRLD